MSELTAITEDAQKRASWHRRNGHQGVFIARVGTTEFEPYGCILEYSNGDFELRGWIHRLTDTKVFSMQDLARDLELDFSMIQRSEWLALLDIPARLITGISS
jgi:hypothetical protein